MNITEYRQKNNLSQIDFAALLTDSGEQATQALVSHWETGRVAISPERAMQIDKLTNGEIPKETLRPDIWA